MIAIKELSSCRGKILIHTHDLFDRNGRRVPPPGLAVQDPNPACRLNPPAVDYENRLARLEGVGLSPTVTANDLRQIIGDLFNRSLGNRQIKGLWNGVFLPIVIPQIPIKDYGESAESFVAKAGQAYRQEFKARSFINHRQGEMNGSVTIVPDSRHQELVDKMAKNSVVGIYFPCALQGYSVQAQRLQMSSLPEGFFLSGVIDAAIALIMYPDILGSNGNSPFHYCPANQWVDEEFSLTFLMDDDCASFAFTQGLAHANGDCSGGLFFAG